MEIKIKIDSIYLDEPIDLILSNEMLNNDNFVDLHINDFEYTVSIDDLLAALESFKKIRDLKDGGKLPPS